MNWLKKSLGVGHTPIALEFEFRGQKNKVTTTALLAEGGYSFVYQARQSQPPHRQFAAKKVLAQDEETRGIAEMELQVLERLAERELELLEAGRRALPEAARHPSGTLPRLCDKSLYMQHSGAAVRRQAAAVAPRAAGPRRAGQVGQLRIDAWDCLNALGFVTRSLFGADLAPAEMEPGEACHGSVRKYELVHEDEVAGAMQPLPGRC